MAASFAAPSSGRSLKLGRQNSAAIRNPSAVINIVKKFYLSRSTPKDRTPSCRIEWSVTSMKVGIVKMFFPLFFTVCEIA